MTRATPLPPASLTLPRRRTKLLTVAKEPGSVKLTPGLVLPDAARRRLQDLLRSAPHLVLFPSLVLTLTVMAFIMMGDALRDALDPRQRA